MTEVVAMSRISNPTKCRQISGGNRGLSWGISRRPDTILCTVRERHGLPRVSVTNTTKLMYYTYRTSTLGLSPNVPFSDLNRGLKPRTYEDLLLIRLPRLKHLLDDHL